LIANTSTITENDFSYSDSSITIGSLFDSFSDVDEIRIDHISTKEALAYSTALNSGNSDFACRASF
jgi:hypothetical protein